MRKFAGKCVALFLALLMLLTSMPLTALAEAISSESSGVIHFDVDQPSAAAGTEGENADNSAGAGSALQVAQEAAKDNPTSGAYVELFRASLQGSNQIKTGDEFNYEIGYQFNAPPTYKDASGEAQGRLSSKCNSLEEDIERRAPVETFAGPVVDQIKDALKLRL